VIPIITWEKPNKVDALKKKRSVKTVFTGRLPLPSRKATALVNGRPGARATVRPQVTA